MIKLLYVLISSIIFYILLVLTKKVKKRKLIRLCIIILWIISLILIFTMKDNKKEIKKETNKVKTTVTSFTTEKTTTTEKETTTTSTTTKTTNKKTTKASIKADKNVKYIDGAYYVDGYLIVNKTYPLSENWEPKNTYKKIEKSMDGFCKNCIDKEAYEAWLQMQSDAAALNLNLWIQSGYRSYDYQKDLYDGYVSRKGKEAADKSSARPGHSEHQSGLSFDLNTITTSFKDTEEGKWVNNNCYLYGYIIRYPENSNNETGYIFEPWHIRYVGKDLAKKLYNNGNWITMEKYFNLTSEYQS